MINSLNNFKNCGGSNLPKNLKASELGGKTL